MKQINTQRTVIPNPFADTLKHNTRWIIMGLLVSVVLTLMLDYVESKHQYFTYYLSESFLFSSFWWLFVPIFQLQMMYFERFRQPRYTVGIILLSVVAHQLLYPAAVFILSAAFYPHTFSYWQTFTYGLNEYLITDAIVCSLPILYLSRSRFFRTQESITPTISTISTHAAVKQPFSETIWISEGTKRISVPVKEILYISASSPYVHLHLKERKYLHAETLKSLTGQLDNQVFVRIHKSFMVNIHFVQSCQSRLNGDYDITLMNGVQLRLSRLYAKAFKTIWTTSHRVTV